MTRATRGSTTFGGDADNTQTISLAPFQQFDCANLNSSLQLTIHNLIGENYLEWVQCMKLVIDDKRKLAHLIGEVTKLATNDLTLKTWKSKNPMVIAWLINSMEPTIGKSYMFLLTTKEVWDAVSDLENSSQIFLLKMNLWQSKQGD